MNKYLYVNGNHYPFAKELIPNLVKDLEAGINMIRFCSFTKIETYQGECTISLDGRKSKISCKTLADMLNKEIGE